MNEEEFIKMIGNRIRDYRLEKEYTQVQLSDKIGIEDSALRRIEAGRTNPTIKTLLKISNALGVSLNDLVGDQ